jgi:hypothetical protein
MFRHSVLTAALSAALCTAAGAANAAGDQELAQIRAEIQQMKSAYEARIQALEARLQGAETVAAIPQAPPVPATRSAQAGANVFNPAVSLILGGTYSNLSQDPAKYHLQGFMPSGDIGPGARSFNLGESELTLAANIDPSFGGRLTFSLAGDNSLSVEEAVVETLSLPNGFNLKAGRFLSSVGYLNSRHAHTWDFVDAPLAYQAFLGGQYKTDGAAVRWLAPTERFFEIGAEAGNGGAFPGNSRNRNGVGSAAVFAHLGDDIGDSASWRSGVSLLHTGARERSFDDVNSLGAPVMNAFSGTSNTLIVDGVYKWAPGGNATRRNVILQGEYFRREESGTLAANADSGGYSSRQSGWYAQGVYQFAPSWRVGLRHDRLNSGTPSIALVDTGALTRGDFPRLASYNARRDTVMVDYSPSEFSRFRLQFARDQSRPEATDQQIFLQYIMSLGAHGAHTF